MLSTLASSCITAEGISSLLAGWAVEPAAGLFLVKFNVNEKILRDAPSGKNLKEQK